MGFDYNCRTGLTRHEFCPGKTWDFTRKKKKKTFPFEDWETFQDFMQIDRKLSAFVWSNRCIDACFLFTWRWSCARKACSLFTWTRSCARKAFSYKKGWVLRNRQVCSFTAKHHNNIWHGRTVGWIILYAQECSIYTPQKLIGVATFT